MSPLPQRIDRVLLKKRADYFFATPKRRRKELLDFSACLLNLGPTVAIGGFLRDLCLGGLWRFQSDVDFVVDPLSMPEFERFVESQSGKLNKFGGFSIALKHWKVDVWPLERTWAGVSGHVNIVTLDDLLKATFFDWDAILYSILDQSLISESDYFERLQSRVIDVNLEPNPNPLGNAVRALRYACRWEARIGERLAIHVARQVRDRGWATLVASEKQSFRNPILGTVDGDHISQLLAGHEATGGGPLTLFDHVQPELPLPVI